MATVNKLIAGLLLAASCSAYASDTLDAEVENSCAPWDGAALLIRIDALKLTVNLYNEDIARFRNGEAISIREKYRNEESTATVKLETGRPIPWKNVGLEIYRAGSRTILKFDRREYELNLQMHTDKKMFCG